MRFWRRYSRPLLTVAIAAIADFAGRVTLAFDMIRVSALESVLFGCGAVALLWAAGRDGNDRRVRRTDFILVALFALAAIRAAVWATTGNVFAANVTILIAGLVVVLLLWVHRREGGRADKSV